MKADDIRRVQLDAFAQLLQVTIFSGDAAAYLQLNDSSSIEFARVRNSFDRKEDLYCVLFDTQCLRRAVGKLVANNSEIVKRRLTWRARTIVSMRDILSQVRPQIRPTLHLGSAADPDDPDHASITWDIDPEEYGWTVRPRVRVAFLRGQWRLASNIEIAPRVGSSTESWSIQQIKATEVVRESRQTRLNQIAVEIKSAIMRSDPSGILSLCGSFDVSIGEDQYMTCAELRRRLLDHSGLFYCEIFDTTCYRTNLKAFAKDAKNDAEDLVGRSDQVLSVREIFLRAGDKLEIDVSFARPEGEEDLASGTIRFLTPDLPKGLDAMNFPYVGCIYSERGWILSALFPAF